MEGAMEWLYMAIFMTMLQGASLYSFNKGVSPTDLQFAVLPRLDYSVVDVVNCFISLAE